MRRIVFMLVLIGVALSVSSPASAHPPAFTRIATLDRVPADGLSFGVAADGERFVVWQTTANNLRVHDVVTGAERDIALPRSDCTLKGAGDGRAALDCSPRPLELPVYLLLVDLNTGQTTDLHPRIAVPIDGMISLPVQRVGRYWLEGLVSQGDLYPTVTRFYVNLQTQEVRWGSSHNYGHEVTDDPHERNLDTPDLRSLTCGPDWGVVDAAGPPYFRRWSWNNDDQFWIGRCRDGRLVRETTVRDPDLKSGPTVAMNATLTAGYSFNRIIAVRNLDGARLAAIPIPGPSTYSEIGLAGGHVVVWRSVPAPRSTAVYLSPDVTTDAPPPHRARLAVHPDRGIGPVRLGLARDRGEGVFEGADDVAHLLGPGVDLGQGRRLYRVGRAPLLARYADDNHVVKVTTTWPGATVRGHRLGAGLRRLARVLPDGWSHPRCHGRLLAHGDGPVTILRRARGGLVRATVQPGPPPRCTTSSRDGASAPPRYVTSGRPERRPRQGVTVAR